MSFLRKNSQVIPYTLNKGLNTNFAISVKNGQVAVVAPWYFSRKQINQIIIDKKNLILQKLREYEEINAIRKANLESKVVNVFGENYYLKISYKVINNPELYMEKNIIRINLPVKYRNIDNTRIVNLVLEKFYNRLAEKEIEKLMEKYRITLGIAPEDYKIKKMNRCLGKFIEENKIIIINPDIIKYNKSILEYIILHEFCHLLYKTHAKGFYKIIEKYIKNYKNIEKEIKGLF